MREEFAVYSFYGEKEGFLISNGVIVITPTKEIFDGGLLTVNGDNHMDVSSWTATFYLSAGEENIILMSNSTYDMTGNSIDMDGEFGKTSSENLITERINTELDYNLYCEIEITDLKGGQTQYQIPLTVKTITE